MFNSCFCFFIVIWCCEIIWGSTHPYCYAHPSKVLPVNCCAVWSLWGEQNSRTFRSWDTDPSETWSFVRYYFSLWAVILKTFCNYSIGILLHTWSLLWVEFPFSGLGFLYVCACIRSFFFNEVVAFFKKKRSYEINIWIINMF